MREERMAGRVSNEKKGMLYKFKPLIIACCCIVFSMWWLGLNNNQSLDERVYSRDAHNQDISKIYLFLARSAEARGDWTYAIKLYSTVLQHLPDHQEVYEHLARCYAKQGKLTAQHLTAQRSDETLPQNDAHNHAVQ